MVDGIELFCTIMYTVLYTGSKDVCVWEGVVVFYGVCLLPLQGRFDSQQFCLVSDPSHCKGFSLTHASCHVAWRHFTSHHVEVLELSKN